MEFGCEKYFFSCIFSIKKCFNTYVITTFLNPCFKLSLSLHAKQENISSFFKNTQLSFFLILNMLEDDLTFLKN